MANINEYLPQLEAILAKHEELGHLKVSKRGDSLTIFSEDQYGTNKHARLTHLGAGTFGLSFEKHTGRWEKTPFVGPLAEVITDAIAMFGWQFEPMD